LRTSFVTSADGTRLRLATWGDGARDILLVPGLAEHAGRYEALGGALADAGWTATLVELRGHGHSGGKRGHVMHWSEYVDDVKAAVAGLRPEWSMFAHSMGGLVALSSIQAGVVPSRLALSNPLLGVAIDAPRAKILAGRILSRLWPSLSLKNEINPSALSRDPAIGVAYLADPLVFDTITPRWYTEMVAAQGRAAGAAYAVPMAMYVSAEDHITDPLINKEFALRVRAHLRIYPDFRHEILNEIGKEAAMAEIVAWLGGEELCATA
jgi:alpha-beta hydrolase superfamily lysophospholipase